MQLASTSIRPTSALSKMARKRNQETFAFPNGRGGARRGSGRKPKGDRSCVAHRERALLIACHPVHVTVRLNEGLPSLRRRREARVLFDAFSKGRDRSGFRLNHFSIQSNHLHFIVEAQHRRSLSRGMQGLLIRIAKGFNRLWGRRGRVFGDRFHDRALRSPREVRNALAYVLNNARKHRVFVRSGEPDTFSSGRWFDGWKNYPAWPSQNAPISRAHSWLLAVGWRKRGRIPLSFSPEA